MSRTHRVAAGECLSSIAEQYGFFWETLWDHPSNSGLRASRRDPDTLVAGDDVFIPDIRPRTASVPTDARHHFTLLGVPVMLRLTLRDEGEARANTPYVLVVNGAERRGRTGPDGRLEEPIPSSATRATLTVGEGDEATTYELDAGSLEPVSTDRGVYERLTNLGFGTPDSDDERRAAVAAFQGAHGLEPTGVVDNATRAAVLRADEG